MKSFVTEISRIKKEKYSLGFGCWRVSVAGGSPAGVGLHPNEEGGARRISRQEWRGGGGGGENWGEEVGEGKINANGRGGSCSQSVQPHTHNNNHRHTGVWSGGGAHLVDNKKTHTHTHTKKCWRWRWCLLREALSFISEGKSNISHSGGDRQRSPDRSFR